MAGIYIHIPFCKKACHYCNFYFSTSQQHRGEMTDCLLAEMDLQHHYLGDAPVSTLYFGGGTPSILPAGDVQRLLNKARSLFPVTDNPEITLEANPDDLTPEKLAELTAAGVNRLSIGIQSFFEDDLRWMNRAHNAEQAANCITEARKAGITNISIDLIYGGPTLTDERWAQNVAKAIELGVPHLSCYALTVEPGTALDHFIEKNKIEPIDPDRAARHLEMLMNWATAAGYEHYEISNFALPGWHSRHNSSYWKGTSYLGLGPSAHSFNGTSRQWNVANNALYIQSIKQGQVPFEVETLTPVMMLNEFIMISLRTANGCDLSVVAERFGQDKSAEIPEASEDFIAKGLMRLDSNILRLTREGKFFADGIAAELFS
ncbi:radical SAM family heme chaperone HemW [Chitinophaga sedimenti]|uniref:radical SAM family heme chaperone HemW n=1 Tax=Chitinophaga sedimenti TaxID=2033606 RepID=UPI002006CF37|nr:radical SAM family heme chaperone HemW [Chitinophaga sedimenti]MCK7558881.1 radical SAM family heme chaperone HemW [Chitinophaga sedimenti]